MHEVLVNRLGGLSLPRKSVVRLTDRPDMTLDVYRGRKTTIQQGWNRYTFRGSNSAIFITAFLLNGGQCIKKSLFSGGNIFLHKYILIVSRVLLPLDR